MNTMIWMKRSLVALVALLGACSAESAPDEATESSQANLQQSAGLAFSSMGDPHETTGDGFPFENQKSGTFTAIKSYSAIVKDGSPWELMVIKKQQPCNVGVTCNTRAAIYVAGTTLKLFADGTLYLNGAGTAIDSGATVALQKPDGSPSGARLRRTDADGVMTLSVLSPVGDVIVLDDYYTAGWLNIHGTISAARANERVRGSLGCFDADTDSTNDLCKRFVTSLDEIKVNGQETFYTQDAAGVDAFLEAWRTNQGDCLLADLRADLQGHCSW
jgi:hypothetical protein